MNDLAELVRECLERNVRLTPVNGDQLTIDAPRGAVTTELLESLTRHKATILVQLRNCQASTPTISSDSHVVWQKALDLVENDPLFTPRMMQALRTADVKWEKSLDKTSN